MILRNQLPIFALLFTALLFIAGCGGNSNNCGQVIGVNITASSVTADHTLPPPGNQQTFAANLKLQAGAVCPGLTAVLLNSNWQTSDPVDVHLSPLSGTMTTATCVNASPGPTTVTATATLASGQIVSGTASLTCK